MQTRVGRSRQQHAHERPTWAADHPAARQPAPGQQFTNRPRYSDDPVGDRTDRAGGSDPARHRRHPLTQPIQGGHPVYAVAPRTA